LEGEDNSRRIRTLSRVPTTPARAPNRKYSVPISLWLVEKNQRVINAVNGFRDVTGALLSLVLIAVEARIFVMENTPGTEGALRQKRMLKT
jgi:hypothetical protein